MEPGRKEELKRRIVESLLPDDEIEKIVIFGSFVRSQSPNDIDIAVFARSEADYLTRAMRYRRKLRSVARDLPLDVIAVRLPVDESYSFIREVNAGEAVYTRLNRDISG